jgi:hypothetical protein
MWLFFLGFGHQHLKLFSTIGLIIKMIPELVLRENERELRKEVVCSLC